MKGKVWFTQINSTSPEQPLVYNNDLLSSSKRQKVDASKGENSLALELTESSLLNWLKNYNDGVSGLPENIILKSNCLHIKKKSSYFSQKKFCKGYYF